MRHNANIYHSEGRIDLARLRHRRDNEQLRLFARIISLSTDAAAKDVAFRSLEKKNAIAQTWTEVEMASAGTHRMEYGGAYCVHQAPVGILIPPRLACRKIICDTRTYVDRNLLSCSYSLCLTCYRALRESG